MSLLFIFFVSTAFSFFFFHRLSMPVTTAFWSRETVSSIGFLLVACSLALLMLLLAYGLAVDIAARHLRPGLILETMDTAFTRKQVFVTLCGAITGGLLALFGRLNGLLKGLPKPPSITSSAALFTGLAIIALIAAVGLASVPQPMLASVISRISSVPTPLGELKLSQDGHLPNGETLNTPVTYSKSSGGVDAESLRAAASLTLLARLGVFMDYGNVAIHRHQYSASDTKKVFDENLDIGLVNKKFINHYWKFVVPTMVCARSLFSITEDRVFIAESFRRFDEPLKALARQNHLSNRERSIQASRLVKALVLAMIRIDALARASNIYDSEFDSAYVQYSLDELGYPTAIGGKAGGCKRLNNLIKDIDLLPRQLKRCIPEFRNKLCQHILDNHFAVTEFSKLLELVEAADFVRRPYAVLALASIFEITGRREAALSELDYWLRTQGFDQKTSTQESIPVKSNTNLVRERVINLLSEQVGIRSARFSDLFVSYINETLNSVESMLPESMLWRGYMDRDCSLNFGQLFPFSKVTEGQVTESVAGTVGITATNANQLFKLHLINMNNYLDNRTRLQPWETANSKLLWERMELMDAYIWKCHQKNYAKSSTQIIDLSDEEAEIMETLGRFKLWMVNTAKGTIPSSYNLDEIAELSRKYFTTCAKSSLSDHINRIETSRDKISPLIRRIRMSKEGVRERCLRGLARLNLLYPD